MKRNKLIKFEIWLNNILEKLTVVPYENSYFLKIFNKPYLVIVIRFIFFLFTFTLPLIFFIVSFYYSYNKFENITKIADRTFIFLALPALIGAFWDSLASKYDIDDCYKIAHPAYSKIVNLGLAIGPFFIWASVLLILIHSITEIRFFFSLSFSFLFGLVFFIFWITSVPTATAIIPNLTEVLTAKRQISLAEEEIDELKTKNKSNNNRNH